MSFYGCLVAVLILGTITTSNGDRWPRSNSQSSPNNQRPRYRVSVIQSSPVSDIGTSPHYCKATNSLYYVDLNGTQYTILRYAISEDRTYGANVRGHPVMNSIVPVEGSRDLFAVGMVHSEGIIRWDGKSPWASFVRNILEVEDCPKYDGNQFSAAKADPYGRLFTGTRRQGLCDLSAPTYGNLFRLSDDDPPLTLNEPKTIRISNGMAWRGKKFYHIDTCDNYIQEFDYDHRTGCISNGRILYRFPDSDFLPAGMTIDTKGRLYCAIFGGSKVVVVDSRTGKWIMDIPFSAEQISSVAFGGKKGNTLYVTSSKFPVTGETQSGAGAGQLFKVEGLGRRGTPGQSARVRKVKTYRY